MKTPIWTDLRQWLKAIIHHWFASVSCALIAIFQIGYGILHRDWPPVFSWAILAACFVSATFLAWRDEHRKTIGKERRSILNEVVELKESGIGVDLLGALIKVSEEFSSEEDVEWVCAQLDAQGQGDPFKTIDVALRLGLDGKRLKFLQDARVAGIRFMAQAIEYASTWALKNGLSRSDLKQENSRRQ
jgi:hypothetical protein